VIFWRVELIFGLLGQFVWGQWQLKFPLSAFNRRMDAAYEKNGRAHGTVDCGLYDEEVTYDRALADEPVPSLADVVRDFPQNVKI
jgi:hypothetical protein